MPGWLAAMYSADVTGTTPNSRYLRWPGLGATQDYGWLAKTPPRRVGITAVERGRDGAGSVGLAGDRSFGEHVAGSP
jgi:hypothetical protein